MSFARLRSGETLAESTLSHDRSSRTPPVHAVALTQGRPVVMRRSRHVQHGDEVLARLIDSKLDARVWDRSQHRHSQAAVEAGPALAPHDSIEAVDPAVVPDRLAVDPLHLQPLPNGIVWVCQYMSEHRSAGAAGRAPQGAVGARAARHPCVALEPVVRPKFDPLVRERTDHRRVDPR